MTTTRQTQIVAAYTVIGMGVGVLAIIFGLVALLAHSIERLGGGALWLIVGGVTLLLSSVIIGAIAHIVANSIATIKRLK